MRYQFVIFLGLVFMTIISPLIVQADITDIIRKNNADLGRYQNSQNRRSTQEDTKLIIAAYKATDESSSVASNQNVRTEVLKIQINGKTATVRVRATAIAQDSSSTVIGEDIWQRNNNEWKIVKSRVLSSNTTKNRPQVNSTGQTQSRHNLIQAQSLADQSIRGCYNQKKLDECEKLQRIEYTLSNWCAQGDQNACGIWSSVMTSEQMASFNEINKN
jgi:hypothetical protein